MWVRLKGERRRVDIVDYAVGRWKRNGQHEVIGYGVETGFQFHLDTGTEAEMNARFDDMAAYQDASARYKSGVMWCYDMNFAVGEAQGKVSKE